MLSLQVGLDFSPWVTKTEEAKEAQRNVFSYQVDLALQLNLPLVCVRDLVARLVSRLVVITTYEVMVPLFAANLSAECSFQERWASCHYSGSSEICRGCREAECGPFRSCSRLHVRAFTIKLLLSNSSHSFQAAESTNHNLVRPAAVLSDQDQISIVRQQIEAGRLPSALFHAFDGKVGVIKSCFLSYHLSADLESATLVWIHFMTT